MHKTKNHYIKYTRAELENYTKHPESCVQKVNRVEPIRFSPTTTIDFQQSILKILSRKIGKFDARLNGIVLDFRNTSILNNQSAIRQDSPYSVLNVQANFYVFSPRKGAIVTGTVKYINRMSMETVISVVIYRVFNVKVTVKGRVKQERNEDITIRVKDFHFDNVIPFIEGEFQTFILLVAQFLNIAFQSSGEVVETVVVKNSRKLFDDTIDSGISESSVTSEVFKEKSEPGTSRQQDIKIKQERESSVESSSRKRKASTDSDSSSAPVAPVAKKIKVEPESDDELDFIFGKLDKFSKINFKESERTPVSSHKDKDKSSVRKTKKTTSTIEPASLVKEEEKTTPTKEKKSKKKKKKQLDLEEDFETSLQLLLDASLIKKEK